MLRTGLLGVSVACVTLMQAPTASSEELRCARADRVPDIKIFYYDFEYCRECEKAYIFVQRLRTSFRGFNVRDQEYASRLRDGPGGGTVPAVHACGEWFFGFDDNTATQIRRLFTQRV